MRGAGRRRSTSEGEGDRLSSTLDLPEAARFNRLEIVNRYASTPQIDVTGFIENQTLDQNKNSFYSLSTNARMCCSCLNEDRTSNFFFFDNLKCGLFASAVRVKLLNFLSRIFDLYCIEL